MQRNGNDRPELLAQHAASVAQGDRSLCHVFLHYAASLLDRLSNGGLAGRQTLRRQAPGTPLPGQQRAQATLGVGLEQQAPVGLGQSKGAVDHRSQYVFQGQMGLKQGGSFQQQVQLAKTAGARLHR